MELIYITGGIILLGIISIISSICTPSIPQGACDCEECD